VVGLSYTEELVSEYFRHLTDEDKRPKYMVSEHVHFQIEEAKRGVKGWTDIDILAIGKDEIMHACMNANCFTMVSQTLLAITNAKCANVFEIRYLWRLLI
jgi:hypothetical protein